MSSMDQNLACLLFLCRWAKYNSTFLYGEKKNQKTNISWCENYMKSKFQCPYIQFYWNRDMLIKWQAEYMWQWPMACKVNKKYHYLPLYRKGLLTSALESQGTKIMKRSMNMVSRKEMLTTYLRSPLPPAPHIQPIPHLISCWCSHTLPVELVWTVCALGNSTLR